jgi:hypothetical protein
MSMVLDISATLAWVYADETSSPILQVFERVLESEAWVPALWRLEIANVLEMGVRRKRHNAGFKDATLSDLSLLPISGKGRSAGRMKTQRTNDKRSAGWQTFWSIGWDPLRS